MKVLPCFLLSTHSIPCVQVLLTSCFTNAIIFLMFFTNKVLEKFGHTVAFSTSLGHTHRLAPSFPRALCCDMYPHHLKGRTLEGHPCCLVLWPVPLLFLPNPFLVLRLLGASSWASQMQQDTGSSSASLNSPPPPLSVPFPRPNTQGTTFKNSTLTFYSCPLSSGFEDPVLVSLRR